VAQHNPKLLCCNRPQYRLNFFHGQILPHGLKPGSYFSWRAAGDSSSPPAPSRLDAGLLARLRFPS
ncbi:MAG: hypothetical protein KC482_18730, partial [Dehalococcoidia bacterium]|nr:hypothetical protein [Dehalococcoidia bacterium]